MILEDEFRDEIASRNFTQLIHESRINCVKLRIYLAISPWTMSRAPMLTTQKFPMASMNHRR